MTCQWRVRRLGTDAYEVMLRDPDQRYRRIGFVRRNEATAWETYAYMYLDDTIHYGGSWRTWEPFGGYEICGHDWVAISPDGRIVEREATSLHRAGLLLVQADAEWRSHVEREIRA